MECSCHLHPPCNWCMSLTEEEVELFLAEGAEAVELARLQAEEEQEDAPSS